MLLVLPVPFAQSGGHLRVESQAANGLRQWGKHFSPLTVAAPVLPAGPVHGHPPQSGVEWVPVRELQESVGLVAVPLPWGYGYRKYLDCRGEVARVLMPHIQANRYLQFAIGGCIGGDWGATAARLAHKAGRPYAVHTDWVSHRVAVERSDGWVRRVRRGVERQLMRSAEHQVISAAALGLFHGADCFDAYSPWCRRAELVHNVHTHLEQIPSDAEVAVKRQAALGGGPLRLVYAGRAHAMKGPLDWLRVMARLRQLGARFEAVWYGQGPEMPAMDRLVSELSLRGLVRLVGSVPHEAVVSALRASDLLVFCHMTPESPRVLVEALNQGSPIVGYHSSYPAELTKVGGGQLVPRGDVERLAATIQSLDADRSRLSSLIAAAADAGRGLTDVAVFMHRANVIKECLP